MLNGFRIYFKAFRLILSSPKILSLIIVPLAINIALYFLFFNYGSAYLKTTVDHFIETWRMSLPAWATWFAWVTQLSLHILSWMLLLVISALTFTLVSSIIAAPFNEYLSVQTEHAYRLKLGLPPSYSEHKIGFVSSVKLELKRTVVLILGAAVTFFIAVIPFMQIPALFLGSYLLAFEYFGIPMSRRHPSLFGVFWFLIQHPIKSVTFGLFLLLMMALPFASIIYIPLAVVAGTMLILEIESAQRNTK